MLYGNVYRGALMTMLAFSGLVFGFSSVDEVPGKLVLWTLMMVVSLARMADGWWWQYHADLIARKADAVPPAAEGDATRPTPSAGLLTAAVSGSRAGRACVLPHTAYAGFIRFAIGNGLTSILWCVYAVVFYHQMALLELASTMVILSAMAGGAATVLAPSRAISSFYTTLLLVPISIMALIDPGQEYRILGFLGVGFWLAMLSTSAQSNAFFMQVIDLKQRNSELLEDMQRERAEVVRVNQALVEANKQLDNNNANLEQQVTKRTEELFELSNRDALTGLLNRAGFKSQLNEKLAAARQHHTRLAILFIDLDGFKQVNDSLGHLIGDTVLETVARRLSAHCTADQLSRWGGDEFILTAANINESNAVTLAESLRIAVSQPIEAQRNQISLDATIGIAFFPEHGTQAHTLIQKADFTMYQQKRTQRGAVCLYNEDIYHHVRLEEARRAGLAEAIRNNELTVYYQPIVDASTYEVVCIETLLRWRFRGKAISPAVFIPLAEKSGLINKLGTWVLERACIETLELDITPLPAVSVNVSVLQLLEDDFIAHIDRILTGTGFPATKLHLEITESAFAQNRVAIREKVEALKARNIQISIDDFGTGFSSLSQLQLLSFDRIKIDKSFVMDLSSGNEAIIRATLMIAREFGCQTVAEGVESVSQAQRLRNMGVTHLQGFYFARPMPAAEFTHWFHHKDN